MWRRRPGLMLLGMVPALNVFLLLLAAFLVLLWKVDDLVGWATPYADDWTAKARTILRTGLMLAVLSAMRASCPRRCSWQLTLAVGEPFYERIWRATGQMLGGPVPDRRDRDVSVGRDFSRLPRCICVTSCAAGVPTAGRTSPAAGPGGRVLRVESGGVETSLRALGAVGLPG